MTIAKFKAVVSIFLATAAAFAIWAGSQQAGSASATGTQNEPQTQAQTSRPKLEIQENVLGNKNLLPTGPMPVLALVSLDASGELIVRTARPELDGVIVAQHFDSKSVTALDMKGVMISFQQLPSLLKEETLALVSQRPIEKLQLRLFKEDTLLFLLPKAAQSSQEEPPLRGLAGENNPQSKPWAAKLFRELTQDFGPCEMGTQLKHSFTVTNIYAVPLEIGAVRVTCGCTHTSLTKQKLEPNETAELEVTIDTRRFEGEKTVQIYVHVNVNQESRGEAMLKIKAISMPPK